MMTSLTGRMMRPMGLVATALACVLFTASEDISIAGIQGSGKMFSMTAYGQITRFGSIFVNGVEYDISGAQIRINGQPASESALRVGQVVTVNGDVDADAIAGAARQVSVSSAVVGPLAAVDLSGGTLVVLGQRIRLLPDTFLDQSLGLGGLLGLVPGVSVQVSGFPNASGDIVATRVDVALGGVSPRITGVVQASNPSKHTFMINSQTVDYSGVALPDGFANGQTVAVEGYIPLLQTVLRATRLDVVSGVGGAADDLGEVEGVITTFNSAATFTMGSQRVITNGDTVFDLNGQTLGPDLAVVVRGTYNQGGVLVAQEVKAISTDLVGVLGTVESIAGDTLRVLGVDFATSNVTAFDDQSNQNVRPFGPSALHVGDLVEVRAGAARDALSVRRADGATSYYLEGKASELSLPTFKVLGVRVLTTPQTRFPGGPLLGSLRFFTAGANQNVRVRGTLSGQTLIAEEITAQ